MRTTIFCRMRPHDTNPAFLKQRRRTNFGIIMGFGLPEEYAAKITHSINEFEPPPPNANRLPRFSPSLLRWIENGPHFLNMARACHLERERIVGVDFEFHNRFTYDGKRK